MQHTHTGTNLAQFINLTAHNPETTPQIRRMIPDPTAHRTSIL